MWDGNIADIIWSLCSFCGWARTNVGWKHTPAITTGCPTAGWARTNVGWKQVSCKLFVCKVWPLSENQCGMETEYIKLAGTDTMSWARTNVGWKRPDIEQDLPLTNSVEREPMWDGNVAVCGHYFMCFCVEREPMWDGNKPGKPRPQAVWLSENQCGMET